MSAGSMASWASPAPRMVSSSISSNHPSPAMESVTRRLLLVSAFINALASASPLRFPNGAAPVLSSSHPVRSFARAVTM
jgi:hypothetical protein